MSHQNAIALNNTFRTAVIRYNKGEIDRANLLSDMNLEYPDLSDMYGYKVQRVELNGKLLELWQPLLDTPRIKDDIIYDDLFIERFFNIIWSILKETALATANMDALIPDIVRIIKNITRDDYIIVNCPGLNRYYCGRAFVTIAHGLSKLVLFDTVVPDDMNPVTISKYRGYDMRTYQETIPKIDQPSQSKRLMREFTNLKKELDYVNQIEYHLDDGIYIKITTNCGCHIEMKLPSQYPFKQPTDIYVNDIAYIPSIDSDDNLKMLNQWSPAYTIATIVKAIHEMACIDGKCRTFRLDGNYEQ
jgi:hypothetical protein